MRLAAVGSSSVWLAFLRGLRAFVIVTAVAGAWLHAEGAPPDPATGVATPGETPGDAYARLVRALRELESASRGASPRADFRRSGGSSSESQARLDAMRRIVLEAIDVLPRLPRRELDHSQGFELTLPHLAESRLVARAMGEVGIDALRSGDPGLFLRTLEAQRAGVADSAQDDILISSLVAMSVSRHTNGALREALSSGLLDADAARSALAATEALAAAETYRIDGAVAREGEIAIRELAKLRDMDPEARAARLSALTDSESAPIDDASLDASLAKAPAYFAQARAAMADPDRARGRAALDALEQRALAGEFGGALGVLPANFGTIQERLVDLLAETRAVQADLAALAHGEKPAETFMNAAGLYVAAGKSLRALDGDTQRDIEAMRVAGDGLPAELRARALAALRAVRARIGERLLRAARCGRCDFTEGSGAELDLEAGFLIDGVDGVAGAVRLMLVEPLVDPMADTAPARSAEQATGDAGKTAAPRVSVGAGPEPAHDAAAAPDAHAARTSCADRVVAALIALRHYADGRAYGRSLVAQQIARDCADALARYDARGMLDDDARERIAQALGTLDRGDPFGFARALPRERERIAQLPARLPAASPHGDAVRVNVFPEAAASRLPPHAVAFVLGMCTPLAAVDPASPEATFDPVADGSLASPLAALPPAVDGPFSDLRDWFDLAALREANAQRAVLRERLARDGEAGSIPLAGLVVGRPVDIDRRMAQSQGDLERLDRAVGRVSE